MCVFLYSMLHCLKYRIRISFRGIQFCSNSLEHIEVAITITITITITILLITFNYENSKKTLR